MVQDPFFFSKLLLLTQFLLISSDEVLSGSQSSATLQDTLKWAKKIPLLHMDVRESAS